MYNVYTIYVYNICISEYYVYTGKLYPRPKEVGLRIHRPTDGVRRRYNI